MFKQKKRNTESYCSKEVRKYDRDRFVFARCAPKEKQEHLLALYAFNLEVAKIREVTTEQTTGLIRIQWWRDVVEEIFSGAPVRQHEVACALSAAVKQCSLDRKLLEHILTEREKDIEGGAHPSLEALAHYAAGTSSALLLLSLEILAGEEDKRLQKVVTDIGIAWAIVGMLRSAKYMVPAGIPVFPADIMVQADVTMDMYGSGVFLERMQQVTKACAEKATEHLQEAEKNIGRYDRRLLPVMLPGVVCRHHLRVMQKQHYDVFTGDTEGLYMQKILRILKATAMRKF